MPDLPALIRTRRMLDAEGVDAVMAAADAGRPSTMASGSSSPSSTPGGACSSCGAPKAPRRPATRLRSTRRRTAAIFVRPSREIEEQVSAGRLGALALHGAAALTGGVPIVGRRRGRRRHRNQRRDAGRGRGGVHRGRGRRAGHPGPCRRCTHAVRAARGATRPAPRRPRGESRPSWPSSTPAGSWCTCGGPTRAQVASVGVATDKARTAALFRRPEQGLRGPGRRWPPVRAAPGAAPCRCRAACRWSIDGHVIGAVGVSGASSADEDQELAVIGAAVDRAAACGRARPRKLLLSRRQTVREQFQTGRAASRRAAATRSTPAVGTRPGEVEWHEDVTDIMHVVEGEATVVTGGAMLEAADVGAGRAAGERHRRRHLARARARVMSSSSRPVSRTSSSTCPTRSSTSS